MERKEQLKLVLTAALTAALALQAQKKPTAAAVLVSKNGELLIGRRLDGAGWCGAGGHIEAGETPEQAARREAKEEFNIELGELQPLGEMKLPAQYGRPVLFLCTDFKGKPKADGKEMADARWATRVSLPADLFPPFEASLGMTATDTTPDGAHWVTIGGKKADGRGEGGSAGRKVMIDKNGKIIGGNMPKEVQGKKIDDPKTYEKLDEAEKGKPSDDVDSYLPKAEEPKAEEPKAEIPEDGFEDLGDPDEWLDDGELPPLDDGLIDTPQDEEDNTLLEDPPEQKSEADENKTEILWKIDSEIYTDMLHNKGIDTKAELAEFKDYVTNEWDGSSTYLHKVLADYEEWGKTHDAGGEDPFTLLMGGGTSKQAQNKELLLKEVNSGDSDSDFWNLSDKYHMTDEETKEDFKKWMIDNYSGDSNILYNALGEYGQWKKEQAGTASEENKKFIKDSIQALTWGESKEWADQYPNTGLTATELQGDFVTWLDEKFDGKADTPDGAILQYLEQKKMAATPTSKWTESELSIKSDVLDSMQFYPSSITLSGKEFGLTPEESAKTFTDFVNNEYKPTDSGFWTALNAYEEYEKDGKPAKKKLTAAQQDAVEAVLYKANNWDDLESYGLDMKDQSDLVDWIEKDFDGNTFNIGGVIAQFYKAKDPKNSGLTQDQQYNTNDVIDKFQGWTADELGFTEAEYDDFKDFVNTGKFSGNTPSIYGAQTEFEQWKQNNPTAKPAAPAAKPQKKMSKQKAASYTQERKDGAKWFQGYTGPKAADKALRPTLGALWKTLPHEAKKAAYTYTSGSGAFNRPLRGYNQSWGKQNFKGVGGVDLDNEGQAEGIQHLTDTISKSTYDFDMWLQRGVDHSGAAPFLGVSDSDLSYGDIEELKTKLLGKTVQDAGFLSTGAAKGHGFTGNGCIFNIYAPKGTQMLYAEPFSSYGQTVTRSRVTSAASLRSSSTAATTTASQRLSAQAARPIST